MSALNDRRQRARETANGGPRGWRTHYDRASVEVAIEAATRVQITPEVLATVPRGSVYLDDDMRANLLHAAFKAAGFEVIE